MAERPGDSGSFIPTTFIWDVQRLHEIDVKSPEFKELLIRLYQNLNRMALSLNQKGTGLYPLIEFNTNKVFFPNPALTSITPQTPTDRNVFRKVINFGALPNTGTKAVNHDIPFNTPAGASTYSLTQLYGAASDQIGLNYIPLPYASPTAAQAIELRATGTQVIVTTGSNRSAFTTCYIVIEYIRS